MDWCELKGGGGGGGGGTPQRNNSAPRRGSDDDIVPSADSHAGRSPMHSAGDVSRRWVAGHARTPASAAAAQGVSYLSLSDWESRRAPLRSVRTTGQPQHSAAANDQSVPSVRMTVITAVHGGSSGGGRDDAPATAGAPDSIQGATEAARAHAARLAVRRSIAGPEPGGQDAVVAAAAVAQQLSAPREAWQTRSPVAHQSPGVLLQLDRCVYRGCWEGRAEQSRTAWVWSACTQAAAITCAINGAATAAAAADSAPSCAKDCGEGGACGARHDSGAGGQERGGLY